MATRNPQFMGIEFERRDSGLYQPVEHDGIKLSLDLHCSVRPHHVVDPSHVYIPMASHQIVVPPAQVSCNPRIEPTPVNVQVVVKSITYCVVERIRDRWNAAVFYMGGGPAGVASMVGLLALVAIMIALLALPFIYGMRSQESKAVQPINRTTVTLLLVSGQVEKAAAPATASTKLDNTSEAGQASKHDGWMPCPQGMASVYTVIGVGRDGLRVRSEAKADAKVEAILPEGSVVYRDPTSCFISSEGLWVPVTFHTGQGLERSGYISAPIYLKPGIVKP